MTEQGKATKAKATETTARELGEANLKTTRLQQEPASEYWESIVESIGDGFWVFDRSWQCTYINNRQASLVGMPKEEVVGKNVWELFPDLVGTEVYRQLHQAVAEQTPVHFEHFSSTWQGWFELRVYPSANGVSIFTIDITARKQAEEVLQDRQRLVQQLAEMSPGLLYLYDVVEQRNIYINKRSLELLGYPSETVLAMGADFITEVMHPDDLAQIPAHFERLNMAEEGSFFELEYRMRHAQGEWRWFSSRDTVFSRTPEGQVRQILGTAQDITERKRAEEALRESEQHFKIALQTAKLGSWQHDLVTGTLSCSEQCKANVGLPPDADFSHETLFAILHPEDHALVEAAIQRTLEEHTDYEVEERCFWPDGSLHWLIARGGLVYDSDGTPVRLVGVTLDITERKQFEESLKAAHQRISNILASITDAFVTLDNQWCYSYVNQEAARLLQHSAEELLGKRWQELFPEAAQSNAFFAQELERAVAEQVTVKYEAFCTAANCWLEVSAFPFPDGLSIYFWDISDRKQKEQRKAAQYAVTRVLAEATTFADAVPAILQSLCESLEWQLGVIWSVDRYHNVLRYVDSWQSPVTNAQELIEANRHTTFAPSVGLPGQIWTSRQPIWISVLSENTNFPRAASAAKVGLHTVFAFPILLRNEILGVIECFSERVQEPDEDLLQMMAAIGSQIGQFMERKRTEEALRESQELFQSFMNHSPISAFIKDEAGRYIYLKPLVEGLFQYTPDDLVGKTDFDLLPVEVAQQLRANDAAVLAGGEAIQVPETIQLEDGEQHFMSFKFPFQDASGRQLLAGVALDISDRIHAEEALREQEQRYRRIFETTGVSIWEEDFTEVKAAIDQLKAQGVQDFSQYLTEHPEFVRQAVGMVRVVNVNQATVRMFGAQDKQGILNSLAQIFVPETLEVFVGELLAIAQEQTCFEAETILKTLQGELLNVIFTITFPPPTAKFDSVLVSIMNITDRKRAENALRESEIQLQRSAERFELAVAAVNCLIYDWDVQQDIVYRTEGLTRILGYSLEEAEPTSQWWTERIHPEDVQRVQNETELALANSDRCTIEYRVRNKDNQYVYVVDHGIVTRDADGRIMRLVGSTIDITERKQAEAERECLLQRERAANELLQLFIEHAPAAVAMLDRQMRYLFTSRRWLQEYGAGYTSLTGLCHYDVVPDMPDEWRGVHQRCLAGATERRQEDYFVRADGLAIWLHWEVLPWYTSGGDIGGIIIFAENITDRKQAEQEREQLLERERVAREQAENANRIKDEFLAVLSHELRSPLNPILGWTKLLRSRKFDEKAADRALETIERNAKLQTQLIEDLLDVSRILQGKMVLDTSAVNLAATIEAALETVRLAASAKDIQIHILLDSNVGNVWGDSNRLQQVIWNLVSNAVKFTPSRGWVEVRLEQVGGDAQIQVRDNGKGISPEFLPHVFEYFRQADGTTTRTFGGLGLGLAIVRHLVELHGGSVLADSPGEGLGATFTVRLPLMETSPEVPQEVPSYSFGDLGGLHVLIVDDEADIRDLVAFILEQSGAEVTVATSASEALAALTQALPDVILCDIGMPEVDGYMLMRGLRALPSERGGLIPAIALTAYAGESNQKQALAAGFQLHISKPVEPEELVRAIAQLVARDKET